MKFILATKNAHKLHEFTRVLSPLGIEVISQADVNVDIDVVENADTFEGNARLKARAIFNETHLPTIADDSGIEVLALGNEPGIYSARYGGESCQNDVERCDLLLKNMQGVSERSAQFVCAIYLILSETEEFSFLGVCKGELGYSAQGLGGFGYDPVFIVGDKSFAEIEDEQKDAISHRGIALRKMEEFLKNREELQKL